jgi:hypothetical protein
MNPRAPFTASDLEEIHARLFSQARRVVPMHDVARGDTGADVIGLRHDVDDNPGSLDTALRLAQWEFEHGYTSTFFLLHGSHYWGEEMLVMAEEIEDLGHEIGIHVNALGEALRTGRDPHVLFDEALSYLRTAVRVVGCVAHGDPLCRRADESIRFVNDEMFTESPRPGVGPATRILSHKEHRIRLAPIPRATYGLQYDANWLSRGDYLSDSGGRWSQPFERVVSGFGRGQLHVLIHPDWWADAFVGVTV